MRITDTTQLDRAARFEGAAALAGRLLLSVLFVLSGMSKLAAPAATIAKIQAAGLPLPSAGFAIAALIETVGVALLVAGYRVRLVAAAFIIYSLATACAFHSDLADKNQFIHFFKNVAIAGGFFQILAFGGGALSLDSRRAKLARHEATGAKVSQPE